MAAIKQHAIGEKRAGKGLFFPYIFAPLFMFGLNFKHIVMSHMCFEMQNKLSKTRINH